MLRAQAAQRGISLIEVIVALAILGIVMALVAPSAGTWIANTRLRNAADSVLNGVQSARLEALKRNRLVSFRLSDADSTAWEVCLYDQATDACSADPGAILASKSAVEASEDARVGIDTAMSDAVAALAPGAGVPAMATFDSFGRLATTGGTPNIQRVDVRNPKLGAADERRLVIYISLGGQIRMCDPKLVQANNPQGCA